MRVAPPVFSVILPTYNRARMARTALKTVQMQTFPDWECLVVDDGSTDDTGKILLEFKGDARIRVLRSGENAGMNASRNKAIAQASGEFVSFIDSDDLWLPRRLERFRARMAENPEAGFLFSNAYVWRFGRITSTLFDPRRTIPEGRVPGWYAVGDERLPYVTTNVAVRGEAFRKWGLFRTEMRTLDTELFARFLAQGLPVAAIREPLSVRRAHPGQLTGRHVENFKEALLAMKSGGAPDEELESARRKLCRRAAVYLLKAARPKEARDALLRELGGEAKSVPEFSLTFIPAWALRSAKSLRRAWIVLTRNPAWAPPDVREAYKAIAPLIAEESA